MEEEEVFVPVQSSTDAVDLDYWVEYVEAFVFVFIGHEGTQVRVELVTWSYQDSWGCLEFGEDPGKATGCVLNVPR